MAVETGIGFEEWADADLRVAATALDILEDREKRANGKASTVRDTAGPGGPMQLNG